jgi:hypothetical protein
MKNLLLEKGEYEIETTNFGIWRSLSVPTVLISLCSNQKASNFGRDTFHLDY